MTTTLEYTYWEDDGWLVGYLHKYPEHYTQGQDLTELEEMLVDVYNIRQEEEARFASIRKTGVLLLEEGVLVH